MYTNKHFNFIFFFLIWKLWSIAKKFNHLISLWNSQNWSQRKLHIHFHTKHFQINNFLQFKKKKRMSLCHKDFVFQRLTISNIICILNFDMGQLNFWTSKLNLFCYNFVLLYIVIHGTILRVHSIAILVL